MDWFILFCLYDEDLNMDWTISINLFKNFKVISSECEKSKLRFLSHKLLRNDMSKTTSFVHLYIARVNHSSTLGSFDF